MADTFEALRDGGELTLLDEQLARGIARIGGEAQPDVLLGAALASRATRLGHVCLDVRRFARPEVDGVTWPDLRGWLSKLRKSPLVGDPSEFTPLVLEGERLYLRRYFRYEKQLADQLTERAAYVDESLDGRALRASLDRLFPHTGPAAEKLDGQRLAALVAVVRRFCVISGGPGTGKTTTVVKILALLAEQAVLAGRTRFHATLLAPTGKAAARLHDAIQEQRARLRTGDDVTAIIPDDASTIHRALRPIPGSLSRFRHNAENPLPTDLVLVDEASMVDLALMARLVDAVPPHARLVLLGDRNQLASVEAGAILGDLCGLARVPAFSREFAKHVKKLTGDALPVASGPDGKAIADCVVQLHRNYRYSEESGISALAQAINLGNAERAIEVLGEGHADVMLSPSPTTKRGLGRALRARVVAGYRPYLQASGAVDCLRALNKFRVLAPHRRGPSGVEKLNQHIVGALREEGLLRPDGDWYARRPVLVTENDYEVDLFNGDVGVCLADDEDGDAIRAWFFTSQETVRRLAPSRLPPHETVFAMTVHKAQGSEFDDVVVVLPPESSPLLTRELLYTAITRPRRSVTLFGDADVIAAAVKLPIERASGLREKLWGDDGG
jgi:exodeoxyribonuclease V alpha subunit